MDQYYYSTTGEDVDGPISGSELWQMLASGYVPLDAQACREGSEEWFAITDLKPVPLVQTPVSVRPSEVTPSINSAPPTPSKTKRRLGVIAACVLAMLVVLLYPRAHNSALRSCLKKCETYGAIGADAYYDGSLVSDVVVFDLTGDSSSGARRIDPVHLLMQFAAKLDFSSLRHVVLARDGKQKFYIPASDLRELVSSYDGGGRIWAFDHLPERCRTMSGSAAFDTWTGGWLGVAQHQADDLNLFIREWSGY